MTGILGIKDDALYVEFEIADAISGILRTTVKVTIPQAQIADAHYRNGIFGGKLTIRTKELSTLDDIPWRQGAEFDVSVRRRDRKKARQFAEDVGWMVS